tara:strand:- start:849 stop:1157 length:309 start_codon:yes stop_codon:yes gene_type:complete
MAKKEKLEKKKAGPIDKRAWGVWGSRSFSPKEAKATMKPMTGPKEAKATMQPKKCKGALVWDYKTGKCVLPQNMKTSLAKERLKPVAKTLKKGGGFMKGKGM